jgi:hypothetical protein
MMGEFVVGNYILYTFDPARKKNILVHDDKLEKGEKDTYIESEAITVTEKGVLVKVI